jgi:hypothetical protein
MFFDRQNASSTPGESGEIERLPDGSLAVKFMNTWRHDLELEANKPAIANGELTDPPCS